VSYPLAAAELQAYVKENWEASKRSVKTLSWEEALASRL
jgi:hypothetical protein